MTSVIVTMKLMPESPGVDLSAVQEKALSLIKGIYGEVETKTVEEPIAFGLKALKLTFVMDESKGSPDALEGQINALEGVKSVETVDVRRAIG